MELPLFGVPVPAGTRVVIDSGCCVYPNLAFFGLTCVETGGIR
jgi:hypothetical protein